MILSIRREYRGLWIRCLLPDIIRKEAALRKWLMFTFSKMTEESPAVRFSFILPFRLLPMMPETWVPFSIRRLNCLKDTIG